MKFPNFKTTLIVLAALQLATGFAEPISDRITVTVHGTGPDVVLIPGLTCSSAVWDATVARFEGKYRLHVVQIAGFAGAPSLANTNGPILQPAIDAIDSYIKTNHLKSPRIIGHSMGGLAGMTLALQHPEDVDRLMVVDSLPFFSVLLGAGDVAAVKPQAAAMRDDTISQTQEAYAQGERSFLPHMVKSPAGQKVATGWAIASDKSVVARAMYEIMTTDLRTDLPKIKAPVTMLYPWDTATGFSHEATDKLYHDNFAALPDKKLICVEDSFHFIMLDQPEKFAAQVETFLK